MDDLKTTVQRARPPSSPALVPAGLRAHPSLSRATQGRHGPQTPEPENQCIPTGWVGKHTRAHAGMLVAGTRRPVLFCVHAGSEHRCASGRLALRLSHEAVSRGPAGALHMVPSHSSGIGRVTAELPPPVQQLLQGRAFVLREPQLVDYLREDRGEAGPLTSLTPSGGPAKGARGQRGSRAVTPASTGGRPGAARGPTYHPGDPRKSNVHVLDCHVQSHPFT